MDLNRSPLASQGPSKSPLRYGNISAKKHTRSGSRPDLSGNSNSASGQKDPQKSQHKTKEYIESMKMIKSIIDQRNIPNPNSPKKHGQRYQNNDSEVLREVSGNNISMQGQKNKLYSYQHHPDDSEYMGSGPQNQSELEYLEAKKKELKYISIQEYREAQQASEKESKNITLKTLESSFTNKDPNTRSSPRRELEKSQNTRSNQQLPPKHSNSRTPQGKSTPYGVINLLDDDNTEMPMRFGQKSNPNIKPWNNANKRPSGPEINLEPDSLNLGLPPQKSQPNINSARQQTSTATAYTKPSRGIINLGNENRNHSPKSDETFTENFKKINDVLQKIKGRVNNPHGSSTNDSLENNNVLTDPESDVQSEHKQKRYQDAFNKQQQQQQPPKLKQELPNQPQNGRLQIQNYLAEAQALNQSMKKDLAQKAKRQEELLNQSQNNRNKDRLLKRDGVGQQAPVVNQQIDRDEAEQGAYEKYFNAMQQKETKKPPLSNGHYQADNQANFEREWPQYAGTNYDSLEDGYKGPGPSKKQQNVAKQEYPTQARYMRNLQNYYEEEDDVEEDQVEEEDDESYGDEVVDEDQMAMRNPHHQQRYKKVSQILNQSNQRNKEKQPSKKTEIMIDRNRGDDRPTYQNARSRQQQQSSRYKESYQQEEDDQDEEDEGEEYYERDEIYQQEEDDVEEDEDEEENEEEYDENNEEDEEGLQEEDEEEQYNEEDEQIEDDDSLEQQEQYEEDAQEEDEEEEEYDEQQEDDESYEKQDYGEDGYNVGNKHQNSNRRGDYQDYLENKYGRKRSQGNIPPSKKVDENEYLEKTYGKQGPAKSQPQTPAQTQKAQPPKKKGRTNSQASMAPTNSGNNNNNVTSPKNFDSMSNQQQQPNMNNQQQFMPKNNQQFQMGGPHQNAYGSQTDFQQQQQMHQPQMNNWMNPNYQQQQFQQNQQQPMSSPNNFNYQQQQMGYYQQFPQNNGGQNAFFPQQQQNPSFIQQDMMGGPYPGMYNQQNQQGYQFPNNMYQQQQGQFPLQQNYQYQNNNFNGMMSPQQQQQQQQQFQYNQFPHQNQYMMQNNGQQYPQNIQQNNYEPYMNQQQQQQQQTNGYKSYPNYQQQQMHKPNANEEEHYGGAPNNYSSNASSEQNIKSNAGPPAQKKQQQYDSLEKGGVNNVNQSHEDVKEIKNYIKEQEEFLKKLENDKLKTKQRIENFKNTETKSTNATPRKIEQAPNSNKRQEVAEFEENQEVEYVPSYESKCRERKSHREKEKGGNVERARRQENVGGGHHDTEEMTIPDEGIMDNKINLQRGQQSGQQNKPNFQFEDGSKSSAPATQSRVSKWSIKGENKRNDESDIAVNKVNNIPKPRSQAANNQESPYKQQVPAGYDTFNPKTNNIKKPQNEASSMMNQAMAANRQQDEYEDVIVSKQDQMNKNGWKMDFSIGNEKKKETPKNKKFSQSTKQTEPETQEEVVEDFFAQPKKKAGPKDDDNKPSLADYFMQKRKNLASKLDREREENKKEKDNKPQRTKEEILKQRKEFMKPKTQLPKTPQAGGHLPSFGGDLSMIASNRSKTPTRMESTFTGFAFDDPNDKRKQSSKEPPLSLLHRLAAGEKAKVTSKDMKKQTQKRYQQLPEMQKRKVEEQKKEEMRARREAQKTFEKKLREKTVNKLNKSQIG